MVHAVEDDFLRFFRGRRCQKIFFPQLACASSSFIPPYQKLGQNSKNQKSYGQKPPKKAYLPGPLEALVILVT